jgi:hypothetical protein
MQSIHGGERGPDDEDGPAQDADAVVALAVTPEICALGDDGDGEGQAEECGEREARSALREEQGEEEARFAGVKGVDAVRGERGGEGGQEESDELVRAVEWCGTSRGGDHHQ